MPTNVLLYKSPIGLLKIVSSPDESGISKLCFVTKNSCEIESYELENKHLFTTKCEVLKRTKTELEEYFAHQRTSFDIPLMLDGSAFQIAVWQALQAIPYGKTLSYKDIAIMLSKPKACRAVGMANNRNPIMIIVPCHRVIGKNGSLVGYAAGLDIKQKLLDLEASTNEKNKCNANTR